MLMITNSSSVTYNGDCDLSVGKCVQCALLVVTTFVCTTV